MHRLNDILLVEDNPYDVELMSAEFRRLHLPNDLIVARDGEEALDYLYRQGKFQRRLHGNPALILLDIRMPKVNGIEVLHQIKHDTELREIPIVIITAYPEAKRIVESTNLEVAFIEKPLDGEKLRRILSLAGMYTPRHDRAPHRTERAREGTSVSSHAG